MIHLSNITKSFGRNQVLKGINLTVNKGEVVAILGPSGSGKTTLLRCLNYLEKPNDGAIMIDNFSVDCKKASKRRFISCAKRRRWCFNNTICSATRQRLRM